MSERTLPKASGQPQSRPRVPLVTCPTPLERLENFGHSLGGPRVWAKRDDRAGPAGGGNKTRKLEFLLAEGLGRRCDVVLTAGAVQSNHARLTAAACARLGLPCELWLNRRVPNRGADYERSGNLLLGTLLGARVTVLPDDRDTDDVLASRAEHLLTTGARPYVITAGGSTTTGTLGYVRCAAELLEQAERQGSAMDVVVVAVGTGGTLAGLAVGLAQAGWSGRLIGISVSAPEPVVRERVLGLAAATATELGQPGLGVDVEVDDRFVGPGYGLPTPDGIEAVSWLARAEALMLDPVYTGKAMAGLVALVRGGEIRATDDVVFIHTGGWPALFSYQEELSP